MKTLLITLLLTGTSAFAANGLKIGDPFEAVGAISHFYGGPKSAEAAMWGDAFKTCSDLQKVQVKPIGLILNRVSDVQFDEDMDSSSAHATFVCLRIGKGG